MRNIHLKLAGVTLLASMALASGAHAQVVGLSSDTDNVIVGASDAPPPHSAGLPGIGFPASETGDQIADFATLQVFVPPSGGVTTITPAVNPHPDQGYFSFARVGSQQVFYGEWSSDGNVTTGDHTVYYAGETSGTTVPTTGTASYSVNGISDYSANGLLSGTFNANFGTNTLTGSVQSTNYKLDIGTAAISGAGFSGSGAIASNPVTTATLATGGSVSGRFFGASAAALAGIATFSNNQYDTAFGGTKN